MQCKESGWANAELRRHEQAAEAPCVDATTDGSGALAAVITAGRGKGRAVEISWISVLSVLFL